MITTARAFINKKSKEYKEKTGVSYYLHNDTAKLCREFAKIKQIELLKEINKLLAIKGVTPFHEEFFISEDLK